MSVDIPALKIHLSKNAHDAVTAFPEFLTESRGMTFVKVELLLSFSMIL